MNNRPLKVLIGIQARSSSTRLPNKAFKPIAGTMMLARVIEACRTGGRLYQKKSIADVTIAVLTPNDDPIFREFKDRVHIITGPTYDVLARYDVAVARYNPDYIVRITGDCPMLPPFIVSNLLDIAVRKGFDYFGNSDPRVRTSIDGHDCEVISRRLFDEMAKNAASEYDREHVTPWVLHSAPEWAKLGIALNNHDLSHIKLSVDLQEDLDRVSSAFDSANAKYELALSLYGDGVHRI